MKKSVIFCFIGMDGSGKTTLIKTIENRLKVHNLQYHYIWAGWRGFESYFFKPFVLKYKRRFPNKKDFSSYRKNILIFDFLVLVDYVLRIIPEFIVAYFKKRLIIMDRSFYEVIIDNIHNKNLQKGFIKLIDLLLPKYNIFFINVPYTIAYERKKDEFKCIENAKIIYEKYQNLYFLLKQVNNNIMITQIDNTKPIEIVVDEIMKYIELIILDENKCIKK